MSRPLVLAAASLALLLVTAGPPAQAGDQQDPELVDSCDDGYVGVSSLPSQTPPAAMNVLAGWFKAHWVPGEIPGEHVLSAVEVTMRVCDDLDLVPPTKPPEIAYAIWWANDSCTQGIRLIRSGGVPTRVDARQTCAPSPTERVTLPASEYRIEGDKLVVMLRVDGPAAQVMEGLVEGATLRGLSAATWFAIGGEGDGSGYSTLEGDTTEEAGRDFVIGQDKPA
jgi:hypothetical protein